MNKNDDDVTWFDCNCGAAIFNKYSLKRHYCSMKHNLYRLKHHFNMDENEGQEFLDKFHHVRFACEEDEKFIEMKECLKIFWNKN